MANIEFSHHEKEKLTALIQRYFKDELDQEIGRFDAEFLLDFISAKIGVYFYNMGLRDAQTLLKEKLEDVSEAIYALEKITE